MKTIADNQEKFQILARTKPIIPNLLSYISNNQTKRNLDIQDLISFIKFNSLFQ